MNHSVHRDVDAARWREGDEGHEFHAGTGRKGGNEGDTARVEGLDAPRHVYIWYGGSPVAGAAYAGAGVLKSGGGCGRVPITRQGRGGGGAVGRETGYGDRMERQPDDRGQPRRERDHIETVR